MQVDKVSTENKPNLKHYTRKEVKSHNSEDDCWIIIHDQVLDVTNFLSDHPGTVEPILDYAGRDATIASTNKPHTRYAASLRAKFLIGTTDHLSMEELR